MISEETAAAVKELDERMMKAFGSVRDGSGMEAMREAFLPDDFDTIHQARRELEPAAKQLLRVVESVAKQLARGERCAVCGMTSAQAAAIDYDCTYGC